MEALNEKKYNIKIYVEDNLDNESKYQYIIEPNGKIIKTTYYTENDILSILLVRGEKDKNNKVFWALKILNLYLNNDVRTPKQILSLYALLIFLKKTYIINEILTDENYGFDINEEMPDLDLLVKMNDNANNYQKDLKEYINKIKQECESEYKEKKYTKNDILNSKYAIIHRQSQKKILNIFSDFKNNIDMCYRETIRTRKETLYEILINPFFKNELYTKLEKESYDLKSLLCVAMIESGCGTYLEENAFVHKDKKYLYPPFIYGNWSSYMKIFPISYTKNIINKYVNKSLEEDELIELLIAYKLLYIQGKSIKKISVDEMYNDILEKAKKGIYNPGFNYIQGEYVLNIWNLNYMLLYNLIGKKIPI
jgi:hypothetical protein